MKKSISLILAALSIASLFFVSGCADPDESTIPWSRPKDWEGGVPGMGTS
ncbi:hypothetical protein [Pelagicoccus albus]|uniref:Lipoprotein n=1 Tax=Pelagicoccus albus TaxID=415222 RepID=A0A7X1E6V5_9BACT|nr:hypothetical protein [Pelagicoccus albus]MBC2604669.1 hypothetical protein [Pelagicoccus albus]